MTRGGSKQRQQGERRCLIEGDGANRASLIRFVLSPEGVVTPDVLERLEGRGVWVSAKRDVLEKAISKNAFARGFKTEAKIPDGLLDLMEQQLLQRLVSLIAIARKSGYAISGAQKTSEALQAGSVRILFQASDGSEREKRNLSYRNEVEDRFEMLSRVELGMAYGKENVVHAAITGIGLANRVKEEAIRLSLLRGAQMN